MPRFAVLDHDWPHPHRDLLLERDGVLKAWRLPAVFDPSAGVPAEPNFDHRLIYLDYEGPLSDDRGCVTRWDGGELVWEAVSADELRFQLNGTRLSGRYRLLKAAGGQWQFERHADDADFSADQRG